MTLYKHSMAHYEHFMMLYNALQILKEALERITHQSTPLYNTLQLSTALCNCTTTLYNNLVSTMTRTTLYNALNCSKSSIGRGKRDHFREPSGNLPGIFRNLSGAFHGSSRYLLETVENLQGVVTAVRFYFRVASGTSSGFPSGSFQDPCGNVHFEAMI